MKSIFGSSIINIVFLYFVKTKNRLFQFIKGKNKKQKKEKKMIKSKFKIKGSKETKGLDINDGLFC